MEKKGCEGMAARTHNIAIRARAGEPGASVKVEAVPRASDDPPKPPRHERVMDAANWVRLAEWVGRKVAEAADYLGGMFRRRSPRPA